MLREQKALSLPGCRESMHEPLSIRHEAGAERQFGLITSKSPQMQGNQNLLSDTSAAQWVA
ncbi:hypothetical protein [Streptomyces sp. NPDC058620]|uniref:hypothetical protein n=1 Tax=Streptomyces sp. NPDC058620 TaxID=3346560 RepID=UPI00364CC4FE